MSRHPSGGLLRRHRDFRLLWCGETAGRFGASVTGVAMPLVAVSTLHAGTFEVGLLSAAAWVPWLVIGLPAGAWVDRMRRRPVMLAAAAVSLVLFASVPAAAHLGRLSVELLLAVALLTGTAAVFFQTAHSAYLPGILAPGDQPEGNAKLHGSASAAQIAGLGSGGLIAQLAGAVDGMYVNAATFLVSLLCLTCIRYREPPAARTGPCHRSLAGDVRDGLRLIAGDPWLRTPALAVSRCSIPVSSAVRAELAAAMVAMSTAGSGVRNLDPGCRRATDTPSPQAPPRDSSPCSSSGGRDRETITTRHCGGSGTISRSPLKTRQAQAF